MIKKQKAYCFISDAYIGSFEEVGFLEEKPFNRFVLHRKEGGTRVFPLNKRAVEIYFFNSDGTVDFDRKPDLIVKDPDELLQD